MVKLTDDEKQTYREIGKRITEARENKGMYMKDLGNLIGVSESTMSRYESGETKVDIVVIKKIAKILGVSHRWIIGWNGEHEEEQYYLDNDTRELAQYIAENPEQYLLMDASRKLKVEDLKYVSELVKRLADAEKER